MLECPIPLFLLFISSFEFGIILFVGTMIALRQNGFAQGQSSPIPTGQYDAVLLPRLQAAGIAHWQMLQQLSGLTTEQVNQVRMGNLGCLSLRQVQQLANILECSLDDVLDLYGLSTARQDNQALRQEGLRLQAALHNQRQNLVDEWQRTTFAQLSPLLSNYPSIRHMIQIKPDLPAKHLLSLFSSLDALLHHWGYEAIGVVWSQVAYDPQLHQPDQPDINPGELVYVRFVGYKTGQDILCPAKVSRTLPASAQL
jgi:DNA-binding Xre family transcriptional regulator